MKNQFRLKNKKGFTLVELILVLALLSIVIMSAFNFFFFNHNIYNKSDKLSQVQFDVRMASDYVSTTVRNAESISTTDVLSDSIDIAILQNRYALVEFAEFEIINEGLNYILNYGILGRDSNGENEYILESEVFLNNITSAVISNGPIIYFEK